MKEAVRSVAGVIYFLFYARIFVYTCFKGEQSSNFILSSKIRFLKIAFSSWPLNKHIKPTQSRSTWRLWREETPRPEGAARR